MPIKGYIFSNEQFLLQYHLLSTSTLLTKSKSTLSFHTSRTSYWIILGARTHALPSSTSPYTHCVLVRHYRYSRLCIYSATSTTLRPTQSLFCSNTLSVVLVLADMAPKERGSKGSALERPATSRRDSKKKKESSKETGSRGSAWVRPTKSARRNSEKKKECSKGSIGIRLGLGVVGYIARSSVQKRK